jgi:transcriptional regulator with XRE-family HTH domain
MLARNKDPLDEVIGRHIRFYRLRKGMSQSALAKSIGVSFQQVQKYENGTNRVPGTRLIHIARALATPVGAFFGESQADVISAVALAGDRQAFKLIEAFSRLKDERVRLAVLQIVESMAGIRPRYQAAPRHGGSRAG